MIFCFLFFSENGANAVSWAPSTSPAMMASGPAVHGAVLAPRRIVTGGCDNQVKIWQYDERADEWMEQQHFQNAHTQWVRDVAWRPNVSIFQNKFHVKWHILKNNNNHYTWKMFYYNFNIYFSNDIDTFIDECRQNIQKKYDSFANDVIF